MNAADEEIRGKCSAEIDASRRVEFTLRDNIWAQPLDGALPYPITAFKSEEVRDFRWSPSGEKLGVVRGDTDSNIVLLRETNP